MTDPETPPSLTAQITALVTKWRDAAVWEAEDGAGVAVAGVWDQCANELSALLAAQSALHENCHDLVCNGSRDYPRGVVGHGCSCRGRDKRNLAAQPEPTQDVVDVYNKTGDIVVCQSAPTPSAWQPIETAPKEGMRVLLFTSPDDVSDTGEVEIGWRAEDGYWEDSGGVLEKPTHWMPLPPPPADADKEP